MKRQFPNGQKCPFGCNGHVTAVAAGQRQRIYSGVVRLFTWFFALGCLVLRVSSWGKKARRWPLGFCVWRPAGGPLILINCTPASTGGKKTRFGVTFFPETNCSVSLLPQLQASAGTTSACGRHSTRSSTAFLSPQSSTRRYFACTVACHRS